MKKLDVDITFPDGTVVEDSAKENLNIMVTKGRVVRLDSNYPAVFTHSEGIILDKISHKTVKAKIMDDGYIKAQSKAGVGCHPNHNSRTFQFTINRHANIAVTQGITVKVIKKHGN